MDTSEFIRMIEAENNKCHLSKRELLNALRTALSCVKEDSFETVVRQIWNDDFDFADDPFEIVKGL